MVCLACLLPLFLIPVVNVIPLLFYYFMAKVYRLLGWEYRKPERAPAACPYMPSVANKSTNGVCENLSDKVNMEAEPSAMDTNSKSVEADNKKCD